MSVDEHERVCVGACVYRLCFIIHYPHERVRESACERVRLYVYRLCCTFYWPQWIVCGSVATASQSGSPRGVTEPPAYPHSTPLSPHCPQHSTRTTSLSSARGSARQHMDHRLGQLQSVTPQVTARQHTGHRLGQLQSVTPQVTAR